MIIQIAIGENNLGGIRGKVSLPIREEKDSLIAVLIKWIFYGSNK
ncbi:MULTISPECIES: hypothetical protein [Photorhabdus]|nr:MULTISPECIES: hypothetical protein [Photorhabdus]